jgi:TolA-binding protein
MFRTTILTGMALCLAAAALAAAPAFDEAEALAKSNKHAQARQAFLDFAAANPQSPDAPRARLLAANELFEARKYEAFREEAPRVLAESAAAPDAQRELIEFRIGRSWVWQHNWTEGWQAFNDFIANHPDSPMVGRARFEAAVCLYSTTLYDEFLAAAEAIRKDRPADIPPHQLERLDLLTAKVPFMREQYAEAAEALAAHIAKYPESKTHHVTMMVRTEALFELAKGAATSKAASAFRTEALAQIAVLREKMAETPPGALLYYLPLKMASYEGDEARTAVEAQKLIDSHKVGSKEWALGQVWLGTVRLGQRPPDFAAAVAAYDAVLAADVKDDNIDEHTPTMAAHWRAQAAIAMHDEAGRMAAIERLKAMPDGPLKFKFTKLYGVQDRPLGGNDAH